MKTKNIAIKRVLEGKASKAEINALIAWAKQEIAEWQKFIKECEKKLNG